MLYLFSQTRKLLRSVPCDVDKTKFAKTFQVISDVGEFPYRATLNLPIGIYPKLNDIYIDLLELYGFPGDRYVLSNSGATRMTILFKEEQDLLLFKLKWSEYEL